jgi:hypothetical protein
MSKKITIIVVVIFTFAALYLGYRIIKYYYNYDRPINVTEKLADEKEAQYRLSYNNVNGNMTQTLALNQGPAVFEIEHKGEGKYLFLLKTTQGDSVLEIAKGDGDLTLKKTFDVPETKAYLLEVISPGVWTFRYR